MSACWKCITAWCVVTWRLFKQRKLKTLVAVRQRYTYTPDKVCRYYQCHEKRRRCTFINNYFSLVTTIHTTILRAYQKWARNVRRSNHPLPSQKKKKKSSYYKRHREPNVLWRGQIFQRSAKINSYYNNSKRARINRNIRLMLILYKSFATLNGFQPR